MLTWLFKQWLNKFERDWDYDVSYMRTVLEECGPGALFPMNNAAKVQQYCRDVPMDVYFTAALLATRNGDCGPCLQLCARKAERAGVAPEVIRAVLAGDREAMPTPVQLAYDYTRGVLTRDGWDTGAREELRKCYGPRAVVSLSYAVAMGGFYPAFKYALGVGHACQRIRVGDADVVPVAV